MIIEKSHILRYVEKPLNPVGRSLSTSDVDCTDVASAALRRICLIRQSGDADMFIFNLRARNN